jgi:hypothetical protein
MNGYTLIPLTRINRDCSCTLEFGEAGGERERRSGCAVRIPNPGPYWFLAIQVVLESADGPVEFSSSSHLQPGRDALFLEAIPSIQQRPLIRSNPSSPLSLNARSASFRALFFSCSSIPSRPTSFGPTMSYTLSSASTRARFRSFFRSASRTSAAVSRANTRSNAEGASGRARDRSQGDP